jgi:serine/threonine protein kinase
MKRHYLKISNNIAQWVPGGTRGDWQGDIFSDVTKGGELVLEYLEPNERGAKSALHGDRFYVEIGRDRERPDSVFLVRVQTASNPRRTPLHLHSRLVIWPGGNPPRLDDVDELFSDGKAEEEEDAPESVPAPSEASPLLKSRLAMLPDPIRQKLRPIAANSEPTTPGAFLEPFRHLWARYRLDRHLRLPPRAEAFLRTRTTPQSLSHQERAALLDAFGLGLLNQIAVGDESQLGPFLESLTGAPIPRSLRAQLWGDSLQGLNTSELRRELHLSSDTLVQIADDESAESETVRSITLAGVRSAAQKNDPALAELLSELNDEKAAAGALADWVKALVFSEESEKQTASTEVTSAAVPSSPEVSEPQTLASEWVLKLRLPDETPLEQYRRAVVDAAQALASQPFALKSVSSLVTFDRSVTELATLTKEWRDAVGDLTPLQADLIEADRAVEQLEMVLGTHAAQLLREHTITPEETLEIVALLQHPLIEAIPHWLLPAAPSGSHHSDISLGRAVALTDRTRREHVKLFCELASELHEPHAIKWLAAPEAGKTAERHLRDWFERVRDFLMDVPAEMRTVLADESTDLAALQEQAERLAQIRADVPEGVWSHLQRDVLEASPASRQGLLDAYGKAIAFFREEVGSLEGLSPPAIRARVQRELAKTASAGTKVNDVAAATVATVEHNYLEGRTTRATLLFTPAADGAEYGFVSLPLVIETDQPRAMNAALRWDVKGDVRSGWSRDWPNPEPDLDAPLAIPFYTWRRQPDGKHWHFCLSGRLPIRTPKAAHPRVEVELTVVDPSTRQPLGPPRLLKWESIQTKAGQISVVWGDATEPSHVRDHPIGPQERANAIRDKFVAASSVAVIAPRRFGKSTLVEYLIKEAPAHKLLIPAALVCTQYASASGFDYDSFWNDLSERLVDKIGARLKRETVAPLPPPQAFDAVRTAARKKGYKAIVVLLDEAQLFFSAQRTELGPHLKTLLERDLARTDDTKKVPILFGLIGLPSLRERAGADLLGVLNPIEKSRMDEAELHPLISRMTTGLQTTRGARQKLAETAGNLLILRALLEKLAVRATRDKRVWVNYDDVVVVEEALKKDLQDGRELTVASYIRDVLNAADRVDDWRPISSLPAAAAWARTWAPGRPESESAERTVELLNQWCRLSRDNQPHVVRPVYTTELLGRHLQQLRERQVLDGAEFSSPLLHSWLVGIASRSSFDDGFRAALFSGAQRRIKRPSGAAPIAEGAEATVFRSGDFAYRTCTLSGQAQRDQFLEGAEMLEALRQVIQRREAGSDHIFELVDVGLSDRNDREAMQVYRWVEGQSLAIREGGLAGDIVIDIGAKLARAVRLLHRYNVLHRDICPRNIILDDVSDPLTIRPVLIDFGFARFASATMHTAIAGAHIAPEVRGPKPEWTRAADIYGLGSTLAALLDPKEGASELRKLLARTTSDKAESRPAAEELLEALEQLEIDHAVNQRREEAWRKLWAAAGENRHIPWFSAQMNKMRESLVNVSLGFYRIPIQRHGVIADFMNQLAESSHMTRSSLFVLGLREQDDSMQMIGALRNQHVHGRGKQTEEQRLLVQRFERLELEDQKKQLSACAASVARLCQLKVLPALLTQLIS